MKTIAHSSSSPSSPIKEESKLLFQSNSGMNYNFVSKNDRNGDIGLKSVTKTNYKLTKILNDIGVSKQSHQNGYLTNMVGTLNNGLVHPLSNGLSQTRSSFNPNGFDSNLNHRHSQMMHYNSQSHTKLETKLNSPK